MLLQYAFFARAADLSSEGLFSAIGGGIDIISAIPAGTTPGGTPFATSSISLVIRLQCRPEECAIDRKMRIERVAPDGAALSIGGATNLNIPLRAQFPELTPEITLCINLVNMAFLIAGQYAFRIIADEEVLGVAPLFVHIPEQGG